MFSKLFNNTNACSATTKLLNSSSNTITPTFINMDHTYKESPIKFDINIECEQGNSVDFIKMMTESALQKHIIENDKTKTLMLTFSPDIDKEEFICYIRLTCNKV